MTDCTEDDAVESEDEGGGGRSEKEGMVRTNAGESSWGMERLSPISEGKVEGDV